MNNIIIETQRLCKTFSTGKGKKEERVEAVKGVDLQVSEGEIFGFLGPNGAGKSTTLNMLTTLLRPSSGRASVTGFDLLRYPQKVRQNIGYVSQAGGADNFSNAYENLILQGRLYGISKNEAQQLTQKAIEQFQMEEFAYREAKTYSGGQKRRLELALGVFHHPKLVFLDEPTTGLDPQSRAYFWGKIRDLKKEGMTVFLTTHYLEEADNLCDRIAIIDHGAIVAVDTPMSLKREIKGETIIVEFKDAAGCIHMDDKFSTVNFIRKKFRQDNKLHLLVENGESLLAEVLRIIDKEQIVIQTIGFSRPSLDDVFLQKTGRSLREGKN